MSAQIFQCLFRIFLYAVKCRKELPSKLPANLLVLIQLFATHRLLNFRIKDCLDQRKQAAVRKSRIVDCSKDKLITEIPEQEQNHQYDAYPVKDTCFFASLFGREEPAV